METAASDELSGPRRLMLSKRWRGKGRKLVSPVSRSDARLQATWAARLAVRALEKIEDPADWPQERVQRRRKLTKGPSEFREDRIYFS
jgi:hypothetical protein